MERDKAIKAIQLKIPVIYKDIKYIPIAYRLGLYNNRWTHSLELLDKNNNSVVMADMSRVQEVEHVK